MINGSLTGSDRQGLQPAVLSGKDPLNITLSFPGAADYTPILDLHPVVSTPTAIKNGKQTELTSAAQMTKDFKAGLLASAGKGPAKLQPRRTPRDRPHLHLLHRRRRLKKRLSDRTQPNRAKERTQLAPAHSGGEPTSAERTFMTVKLGLLALLDAKPGKGDDLASFLESGRAIAAAEHGTITWYAFKISDTSYGIFDTFETEDARQAHINGEIPKALATVADDLLASDPDIRPIDILAVK